MRLQKQQKQFHPYNADNQLQKVVITYDDYIRSINGLFNLTNKEILVLSIFCQKDYIVNFKSRKEVRALARIDSSGLSRVITRLKNKGLLISSSPKGLVVNRDIIPYMAKSREYVILIKTELK